MHIKYFYILTVTIELHARTQMVSEKYVCNVRDAMRRYLKKNGCDTFDSYAPTYWGYIEDRDIFIVSFDAWRDPGEEPYVEDASFLAYVVFEDDTYEKPSVLYVDCVYDKLCSERGGVLDHLPVWAETELVSLETA